MAALDNRVVVIVAVIGLVGTLGAALISNWDRMFPQQPRAEDASGLSAQNALVAPHAPPIEINQRFTLWGEQTMQFELAPGETKTLKGMELYAHVATFPDSGCAGPGFIPYTWQVRVPYPKGGDLEIRRVLMGGATEQIALGSMGGGTMGYCDEHTFKNNGTERIQIEVRYASAAGSDE